jgi:hypothetical protein
LTCPCGGNNELSLAQNVGNILTSKGTIFFLRRPLLHAVVEIMEYRIRK